MKVMIQRNGWPVTRTLFTRTMALFCALGVCEAASAGAPMRSSASYAMQFDGVAQGGGSQSSTSYRQAQTTVGQEPAWGVFPSAGFTMQTGGVLWGAWVPVTLSAFTIE